MFTSYRFSCRVQDFSNCGSRPQMRSRPRMRTRKTIMGLRKKLTFCAFEIDFSAIIFIDKQFFLKTPDFGKEIANQSLILSEDLFTK